MNFDTWWGGLVAATRKTERDPATEYHYIVVDKLTGASLVKSILDIHSYKTNPCNILQIGWKNEFAHADYEVKPADYRAKVRELLGAIQTSIRQKRASEEVFAAADIATF
jgi:hypothetical protein